MSMPPPPPAAMIAPVRESMTLDEKLARLEAELDAALRMEHLDDAARVRLFRAEAITDRLLEERPPVAWLARGYEVEANLRQLQSLADRIVAELRREEPEAMIREDILRLRREVGQLRPALAMPGGGALPVPLDSLLAGVPPDSTGVTVTEGARGE